MALFFIITSPQSSENVAQMRYACKWSVLDTTLKSPVKKARFFDQVHLHCCVPGVPGCLLVRCESIPDLKLMSTVTLVMVDEILV